MSEQLLDRTPLEARAEGPPSGVTSRRRFLQGSAAGGIAALLAATRPEDVMESHVDVIEINHFYDDNGRLVFDQIIFYDWCNENCRYDVRAWRLIKSPSQMPTKNQKTGKYEAVWQDGDILRKVRCASVRETWTQYDPELLERDILPKDQRRELTKLLSSKKP